MWPADSAERLCRNREFTDRERPLAHELSWLARSQKCRFGLRLQLSARRVSGDGFDDPRRQASKRLQKADVTLDLALVLSDFVKQGCSAVDDIAHPLARLGDGVEQER
jgi:hypothetical protein